jgi:tetratricopeptide (TPR) repeat protein
MKIYVSSINIPGVGNIGENPLPVLRDPCPHREPADTGTLRTEDKVEIGKNIAQRVLPYLTQDRYGREKKPVDFKTIVMDNGILRAEFLTGFGGRLRSLYDLRKKKELLFANPVIQPGNLAIRNAWLSGGIEWNIGQVGHTFTTCSPVFFARVRAKSGEEFLRIYEYERQKKVFWMADFHLPDGSEFLQVHVRIVNDQDEAVPMYWWTNIAVPEVPETRVFSSSEDVLYTDAAASREWLEKNKDNGEALRRPPIFYGHGTMPHIDNEKGRTFAFDGSIPRNFPHSMDFFFQNPPAIRSPWEAAAYPEGFLFFMRNTQPLRCNKMFCWGNGRGGRFWCDYLSEPGKGDYLELQAGIAPSQIHGYTMAANCEISFTQFFGSMEADAPEKLYLPWEEARPYAESLMEKTLKGETVLDAGKRYKALAEEAPAAMEILHSGSGWGALEALRRERQGGKPVPAGLVFPESAIGGEQLPWLTLLMTGELPPLGEGGLPASYMTDTAWKPLLEKAPGEAGGKPTGAAAYLAVMLWENLQGEEAVAIWEREAERGGNALALRNLAAAARHRGDSRAALEYMKKAFAIEKGETDPAFAEEYLRLLLYFKDYEGAWKVFKSMPEKTAGAERVQLLAAQAAVEVGEYGFIGNIFNRELAVIQEGETTLTDIWFKAEAQKLAKTRGVPYTEELLGEVKKTLTPPKNIDFRMG